jgi:hypothetical protein
LEHLEQQKNHQQAATDRPSEVCRKRPTLIIKVKDVSPMAALNGEPQTQTDRANELNNVARQDLRLSVSIALVSALSAHPLFLN